MKSTVQFDIGPSTLIARFPSERKVQRWNACL